MELALYTPRGYPTLLTNLNGHSKTTNVPPVFELYLDAAHNDQAGEDGINGEEVKWDMWVYDDETIARGGCGKVAHPLQHTDVVL